MSKTRFIFFILPEVHLLDLAGPDQVLSEAIDFGAEFEIIYAGLDESIETSAGLGINRLLPYTSIQFKKGDYLIVPGSRVKYIVSKAFREHKAIFQWIKEAYHKNVQLVSICVGAFVFAEAGVLNGLSCTTHFQLTQQLQKNYPNIYVKENVLFISENNIHTSAGIASGIDLMLFLLEKLTDSYFAHKVARELIVYMRRDGTSDQINPHFNHRNHIHSGIHKVQDYIIDNIHKKCSLLELAEIAIMSERNFTRIFKKETGITVNEYISQIRLIKLKEYLNNPEYSMKQIASKIGLNSERQAERLKKSLAEKV